MAPRRRRRRALVTEVYGYGRVSGRSQERGLSLSEQRRLIEDYAGAEDLELTAYYQEVQSSFESGRRARFDDLLEHVEAFERTVVLVEKQDRFVGRNFQDFARINRLISAGRLELHCIKDGRVYTDTTPPGDEFMMVMQAGLDHYHSANLSRETRKGLEGRVREGLWWGGKCPLGFSYDPQTPQGQRRGLVLDPGRWKIVRSVFELAATGRYSSRRLARESLALGLRTRTDRPLTQKMILDMLRNRAYTGKFQSFRGEWVPSEHPAIVSEELFEAVQRALEKRSRGNTRHLRQHEVPKYPWRGLIVCRHCGRRISRTENGRTAVAGCPYTHCAGRKRLPKNKKGTFRAEAILEDRMLAGLDALALPPPMLERAAKLSRRRAPARRTDAVPLERELARLESRLGRARDAYLDGAFDSTEYAQTKARIMAKKRALEAQLASRSRDVTQLREHRELTVELLQRLPDLADAYRRASTEQRRKLLMAVFETSGDKSRWDYVTQTFEPKYTPLFEAIRAFGGASGCEPQALVL